MDSDPSEGDKEKEDVYYLLSQIKTATIYGRGF